MTSNWTQELLNWASANPGWSGVAVFGIAFVESLLVVGFLIPGIFILFGVGALIGLGGLELWPIWLGGSVGALCGDLVSYYIGHRFRRHLADFWPFSRYPEMLERGATFFRSHGAKSVLVGRFIGPLRPMIPACAGMLGMTPARFVAVCVPACAVWTPAYLIPGMLFGASLEVASEYAGRLTLVLVTLVAVLWLTLWALRSLYTVFAAFSARWLRHAIKWTRRHPALGRIAGPILDPSQPEVLSVTMLGLLLVLTIWGFALLMFLSPFGSQPQAIDQAMLAFTQSVRNHIADPAMVAVAQLSRWWVLLPTSLATLLWLLGAQRLAAAAHWLVAMVGGLLLQMLVGWALRATPAMATGGHQQWYEPSAAMMLATIVLGFFAVMVAKELRRRHRKWPYLAAAALLTLLLIARIYLGLDWLSGALVGAMLGLSWTAIVGIAYRQRALRPFSGAVASGIFFGTLAATMVWQVGERLEEDLAALRMPLPEQTLYLEDWWRTDWAELPMERTALQSVASRRFTFQLAAPLAGLESELGKRGWSEAQPAGMQWLLQALNPKPSESTLPLTGKDFLGRREELVMRLPSTDPSHQWVVRWWDSGARLVPGGEPLYVGLLTDDSLVQVMRLFSYWRAIPVPPAELKRLTAELEGFEVRYPTDSLALIRPVLPPGSQAPPPASAAAAQGDR